MVPRPEFTLGPPLWLPNLRLTPAVRRRGRRL